MSNQSTITKQLRLLEFVQQQGMVSAEEAAKFKSEIETGGQNLDDLVLHAKGIDLEAYVKVKSEFLNLPYANLTEMEIGQEILNSLPAEVSENYRVVSFDKQDGKLSIGMVDPDNFRAMEAIDFYATKNNMQVEYFLISEPSFINAFRQYKRFTEEISSALKIKEEEEAEENAKRVKEADNTFEDIVKNAPVAKIVTEIIKHAVESGASDVHIEPMDKETRVRYRIDGILHSSLTLPKNVHDSVVARIKVLSKLKLDETRVPQGGRIRMTINKKDIDFRISVLPLMGDEKVVMRVLDTSKGVLTLEQLGFQGDNLDIIQNNIKKTVGINLVTGPTGSGKSTSLYSVLHLLNKEGVNIVTLEDPVEYFIEGVNQSQIRPEIGFTFASGLRSLLRQDPDIMMVGEIRDAETAELAIHAALTGHLVLSTLHTNDAIGAVPRLLDMKIEPFLLSSTLNTIIAQRLARRLCPHCKEEMKLAGKLLDEIKQKIEAIPEKAFQKALPDFDINNIKIYKPGGCVRCGKTGYKGRVAISEVLDIDDYVKEMILNKEGVIDEVKVQEEQAYISVNQDGILKVIQGVTSLEEVMRVMNV